MVTVDSSMAGVDQRAQNQIRRWLASPELRSYLQESLDTGRAPNSTGPYIVISREAGCGGREVAAAVARRLGWDVLDRELIDVMAERYGMRRGVLELVDQAHASWLSDMLTAWLDTDAVSHDKFFVYLQRIVFLAAAYGRIVFLGRGVHRILPRKRGLSVRLVAPLEDRLRRWQAAHGGMGRRQALHALATIDSARGQFYRRFFHVESQDPHAFDITVNRQHFELDQIADLIVDVFRRTRAGTLETPHASRARPDADG